MAEADQRRRVVHALRALHAIPVENGGCCPGTPDVAYIGGWIETKWLREWPARPDTVVRLDHPLTPQQRLWHRLHARLGGVSWVLLQVRQEWLLLRGVDAADHLEVDCNRAQLTELAHRHWPRGLDEKELLECVSEITSGR